MENNCVKDFEIPLKITAITFKRLPINVIKYNHTINTVNGIYNTKNNTWYCGNEFIYFFYFRILVMDKGEVVEFDEPNNLLNDKTSLFYGMVNSSKTTSPR